MRWKLVALWIGWGASLGSEVLEVQGHRGMRSQFPENSLPAFAAAANAGIDVVEMDLQMTRDGVIVIHHDYYFNEKLCADVDGNPVNSKQLILDATLFEVKRVDCGCKPNVEFAHQKKVTGAQIPSLEELFQMIQASADPHAEKIRFNLELKRDKRHPEWSAPPEQMAKAVVGVVQKYGFSSRVYYSSFDPESLAAIRKVDPKAQLGLIYSEESLQMAAKISDGDGQNYLMQLAAQLKVSVLSPDHELIYSAQDVERLHQAGFRVVPWMVNAEKRWSELSAMGVDGMITDYPTELKQFLGK